MRIRDHLTYANVVATVALFVALGGGAYAVTQIGSSDIENNSIRSIDLRNRAIRGTDVRRNTLRGKQIAEQTLNAQTFAPITGREAGDCDPASSAIVNCVMATVRLKEPSRMLVIATGGQESVDSAAASAHCEVRIDNQPEAVSVDPGEQTTDNSSGAATNGFARTVVSQGLLSTGPHTVGLACSQLAGDVRIDAPTIAAIAIASR